MTEKNLQGWKDQIDKKSHRELAWMWRFSPAGHPIYRRDLPLYEYFMARFDSFGGMTPEISKDIGW